ncbi:sphingosine kinase 1 isoform X2 [Mangifera indica]|uniref:sphingosine kinase 1 isoform X2 n=1 Tax=Mangifera indica TaxID=29780 RepID=UPI001CFA27CE|nr:sphingosine kinase 1 isoform X2 [Mangifera indica]
MAQDSLSDRVLVNGTIVSATLTADGKLSWTEGFHRTLTLENEVLGFAVDANKIRIRAVIEEESRIWCGGRTGGLMRKDFVFEPLSQESRRLWCQKLREYLDSLGMFSKMLSKFICLFRFMLCRMFVFYFCEGRPKSLFIFLNPFGGKKTASKIFLDNVKPLLEDADIQFTLEETTRQLYAKDVAKGLDLSKYDGIVCVSGDGILVEVVNGLLEREDWRVAIKMPLGVIPAGTGNGMVKSLLDSVGEPCKAYNATLAIIRGHKRSLDVATILQGETKFYSVLMLAWGLVADIDIESEKYRWMGSTRIDFYALQRILCLRQYNGRVSFVPATGFEDYGEPTSYNGKSINEKNVGDPSQEQPSKARQYGYQGTDVSLENLGWRTINGPFVSVWLHNVPWGGEDTMAAPDAKFSDGYLDLILIRDCPKLDLLKLMTQLSNGGHIKSKYVQYLKVKAFILEPGTCTHDPTREGIIDSDGEVLARGKGTYLCDQKTLMAYDKLQITLDQEDILQG